MRPGELVQIGGRQVAVTAEDRCAARGCLGCRDHRLSGIDEDGRVVLARWLPGGWTELEDGDEREAAA